MNLLCHIFGSVSWSTDLPFSFLPNAFYITWLHMGTAVFVCNFDSFYSVQFISMTKMWAKYVPCNHPHAAYWENTQAYNAHFKTTLFFCNLPREPMELILPQRRE